MSMVRFLATEWATYTLVVFLAVLAKTILPFFMGLLPEPPDPAWLAKTPFYALSFGLALVFVLLPFDMLFRWVMTPFDWRLREVVPLTLCVTAFEIWDKTSRDWPGGDARVYISIGSVIGAGLIAGSFRAWLRRPGRRTLDLDVVFE